jgi:hypothetical protein
MAAAVFVAGVIAFAVTAAPAANKPKRIASASEQALPQHVGKADRLRAPLKGAA